MRWSTLSLSLSLLSVWACGDKDPGAQGGGADGGWGEADGSDGGEPEVDADGDGFPASEDCDDRAAGVYPGATEVCDGRDNDCDRAVDDDDADLDTATGAPFYSDVDGDGFGDPSTEVWACLPPDGAVDQGGDCDDAAAGVNPDAVEVCDDADTDEDCSGLADDADPGVSPASLVSRVPDADGDGYGDASATPTGFCDPPAGWVADTTDCDDGAAAIHPGATEVCDAADTDEDCSGLADDADPEVDPSTQVSTVPDADGDGYGDAAATPTRSCDPPSNHVTDATDCDDGAAGTHPGATEVCDAADTDEDCSGLADDADPGVDPTTYTRFYGDGDGDGYGDLAELSQSCEAPSGAVTSATDCDDTDPWINPGEAERCDGVNTDCDGSTSEDGLATFTTAAGVPADYTALLAPTSGGAGAATLTSDGTLALCDGTWTATLTVRADVDVVNPGGDETAVILDADDLGAAVFIDADAIDVSISDLTIQGGAGESDLFGVGYEVGGGVFCSAGAVSGTTTLDLDNVVLTDNVAYYGAGLAAYGCAVTSTDTQITDNIADNAGGAAFIYYGTWDDIDGLVEDNVALDGIGAAWFYGASGSLNGSVWSDNDATVDVGGLALTASDFTCTGSSSVTAGILGSTATDDDSGSIYLSGSASTAFTAVDCDLGTALGRDDNDGADLHLYRSDFGYEYGDDATFACDADRCGTSTAYRMGADTYASSAAGYARGFVITATDTATLDSFTAAIDILDSTCDVGFYVLSNSSFIDTGWTVEWSDTVTASLGDSSVASGDIGVPFASGTTYAMVAGWDCEATYHYTSGTSTGSGLGTGTWQGYHADYAYTGYSGSGVELNVNNTLTYRFDATTSH